MNIYISASLANDVYNAQVAQALIQAGHDVVLPQEFCPANVPHQSYPDSVYQRCVQGMSDCDLGLLLMDFYGLDTAWEVGWFAGRGKPMIGFTQCTTHIEKEFLHRGGLAGVITTNPAIHRAWKGLDVPELEVRGRRSFGNRPALHISDLRHLAGALEAIVAECNQTA